MSSIRVRVNKFIRLVQDLNLEEFWWGNIKIQVCCQCKQEINRIRVNKIAIHGTKSKLERESLGPHESVSLSLMGNSPWLEVFNTKLSFFGKTQPIFVIDDNFRRFSLSLSSRHLRFCHYNDASFDNFFVIVIVVALNIELDTIISVKLSRNKVIQAEMAATPKIRQI